MGYMTISTQVNRILSYNQEKISQMRPGLFNKNITVLRSEIEKHKNKSTPPESMSKETDYLVFESGFEYASFLESVIESFLSWYEVEVKPKW